MRLQITSGDSVLVESPGGGGYGDPLKRLNERIEMDLRLGYITKDFADSNYGQR
ncbi:MAG: hypothetical protein WCO80_13935 [Betaproteobacteria bacterium]